jgi:hypothetical protein
MARAGMGSRFCNHHIHSDPDHYRKAHHQMEVPLVREQIELRVKGLNFYYSGGIHALKQINLSVYSKQVGANRPVRLRQDDPAEVL